MRYCKYYTFPALRFCDTIVDFEKYISCYCRKERAAVSSAELHNVQCY